MVLTFHLLNITAHTSSTKLEFLTHVCLLPQTSHLTIYILSFQIIYLVTDGELHYKAQQQPAQNE